MNLPNFIIAGGVATGTGFLSAALVQHPDVYLPRRQRPEPNFFCYSWKFNRGLRYYADEWFAEYSGERAVGERSSLLLTCADAPERIGGLLPQVRLIFCLRNPIERAWGNYRFTVLEGLEPLEFEQALDEEANRRQAADGRWSEVQPHAYVWRSRYSEGIKRFLSVFPREQILFVKSESMSRHPKESLSAICSFLGVSSDFPFDAAADYASPSVHDRKAQAEMRAHFGDSFPEIIEAIRRGEDPGRYATDHPEVIARLKGNLFDGKQPLAIQSRERLRRLFANEILEVGRLTGLDVADWT